MRKPIGVIVFVLALAAVAEAQEDIKQPQQPDYSRNKLIEIFSGDQPQPKPQPKVEIGFGYIDFQALNMRWKVGFLPILMPMYGSMPWAMNGAFGSIPDPFIATGTEIPQTPRTWAQTRAMNAELKRIERTERAKEKEKPNATIIAKPQ